MGRVRKKGKNISGWLVLDKPGGISSNHALGKVRHLLDAKKAGHAGTLDPMATGILPLAFGEATKTIPFMVDAKKKYEFTISFGRNTDTLDAEGKTVFESPARPDPNQIQNTLPQFIGQISQMPPAFSALHVNGKRAYELARAGEAVELAPRTVEIDDLKLLPGADAQSASFCVTCGKGTYVRSLARDICESLRVAGHVSVLRRTMVGIFEEKQAFALDDLPNLVHKAPAQELVLPVETALADIPALAVTENQANDLRQGRAIIVPQMDTEFAGKDSEVVLAKFAGKCVALMKLRDGQLCPFRVFNLV